MGSSSSWWSRCWSLMCGLPWWWVEAAVGGERRAREVATTVDSRVLPAADQHVVALGAQCAEQAIGLGLRGNGHAELNDALAHARARVEPVDVHIDDVHVQVRNREQHTEQLAGTVGHGHADDQQVRHRLFVENSPGKAWVDIPTRNEHDHVVVSAKGRNRWHPAELDVAQ